MSFVKYPQTRIIEAVEEHTRSKRHRKKSMKAVDVHGLSQNQHLQHADAQIADSKASKRRRRSGWANRTYFDVPSEFIAHYAQAEMDDEAKARIRADWDKHAAAAEADDDDGAELVDVAVSPVENPNAQWAPWRK